MRSSNISSDIGFFEIPIIVSTYIRTVSSGKIVQSTVKSFFISSFPLIIIAKKSERESDFLLTFASYTSIW